MTRIEIDIRRIAGKCGWKINEANLQFIVEGVMRNLKRFGRRLCPCRFYPPDVPLNKADICPCREWREEQKCCCNLYLADG